MRFFSGWGCGVCLVSTATHRFFSALVHQTSLLQWSHSLTNLRSASCSRIHSGTHAWSLAIHVTSRFTRETLRFEPPPGHLPWTPWGTETQTPWSLLPRNKFLATPLHCTIHRSDPTSVFHCFITCSSSWRFSWALNSLWSLTSATRIQGQWSTSCIKRWSWFSNVLARIHLFYRVVDCAQRWRIISCRGYMCNKII